MKRLTTSPLLLVAALAALVAWSPRAQAQDKAPELSLTATSAASAATSSKGDVVSRFIRGLLKWRDRWDGLRYT